MDAPVDEAEYSTWTIPISREDYEDLQRNRWNFEAAMSRFGDISPLTSEEQRTGYRDFTSSDGLTGQYAVGWRAEQLRIETDAHREAEMAACPYVECTCGHHEEFVLAHRRIG